MHPIRHTPFGLAAALLGAAVLLPACVVERTTDTPYGLHPFPETPVTPGAPASPDSARAPSLPTGPLTRPASPTASVSARIRASMYEMGTVPYDGLVLPLVSPDGRFLAVEDTVAPTWPTLLAAPGAEVPVGTQIRAFSLPDPMAANPGGEPPAARPIPWSEPHNALLLGRSCDNTGFLVEAPRPDGSRWIGRVSWISGEITWLVQNASVNSYAVLGPAGDLAFCRRAPDSAAIELVVRHQGKELIAGGGGPGGYLWPLFSDEPGIVYAFSLVSGVIELHALKIPEKGEPDSLLIVARQPIARGADAASVYQMTTSTQVPLPTAAAPGGDTQPSERFDKIIFFHLLQRRMVVFDRRLGSVTPLFAGSFAASPLIPNKYQSELPDQGYLIAGDRGLEYVPISKNNEFERQTGVAASPEAGALVMTGSYIPRLTTEAGWPVVLMGPAESGQGPRIHLFRLKLDVADVNRLR